MIDQRTIESYHQDGAIVLRGALSPNELAIIGEAFDHRLRYLSDHSLDLYQGSGATFITDNTNTAAWPAPSFQALLYETSLPDLARPFFSTDDVWFYYEQIFLKEGGAARRTPWHQDSSYIPGRGADFARMWISLDPVEQAHSLEFVRGSHLGPMHNGSIFDPADDTAPLYVDGSLPRLPDIEKDRSGWDIMAWAVEPGDIVVFHPATLHGGAGTAPGVRRRTLSMIYFGADAWFEPRPATKGAEGELGGDKLQVGSSADPFFGLTEGDPFRPDHAIKLRPAAERAIQPRAASELHAS